MKPKLTIVLLMQLGLSSIVFCQKAIELNDTAMAIFSRNIGNSDSLRRAIMLLDSAIASDSSYYVAYWNKVSLLCEVGDMRGQLETLDRLLRIRPRSTQALLVKALIMERTGNIEQANQLYSRLLSKMDSVVQGKPSAPELVNRAFLKLFISGRDDGIAELERLIKTYPDEPLFLEMRSTFYEFDKKKFMEDLCRKPW